MEDSDSDFDEDTVYLDQQEEIRDLEQTIVQLQKENARLKVAYNRLQDWRVNWQQENKELRQENARLRQGKFKFAMNKKKKRKKKKKKSKR